MGSCKSSRANISSRKQEHPFGLGVGRDEPIFRHVIEVLSVAHTSIKFQFTSLVNYKKILCYDEYIDTRMRELQLLYIDVYLVPLVKELQSLWVGVPTIDINARPNPDRFILRAILLWIINEFPAYDLVSGCAVKGYKGCLLCGPAVDSRYYVALK